MNNVLLDLQMAAAHRHELEEEAVHERLALRAIRESRAAHTTLIDRLLDTLMGHRRDTPPPDPRLN